MQKADITADLVEGLVASQFPQWAGLPVTSVEVDGWDNTTFRLGSSMTVRLPSADRYVAQVDKEHRWLPVLAPQLPVPIPVPLGRGEPTPAFPRPWSVYGWIDGDLLTTPSSLATAPPSKRTGTSLSSPPGLPKSSGNASGSRAGL